MDYLFMKKKTTQKKKKKGKFVTENTYQLMFGNDAPKEGKAGKKYFKSNTNRGSLNGKPIIK